jgi:hypothetical protein
MTSSTDMRTFVAQLAFQLGETKSQPIVQLRRIVERVGIDQAVAWLAQTAQIEADGGEMLPNGERRRTPGGVFFRIARDGMTPEQQQGIFFPPRRSKPRPTDKHTPSTPAAHALASATWADRDALIQEANQQPGRATVKITVIGKVGKAVERQGFTLLTLQSDGKLPALPKGIPMPAQPLPTNYILYVGSKQWAKVKESLKNSEDVLIAEGIPVLDPKYAAITVFVTNAATKLLQQTQREQQKPT